MLPALWASALHDQLGLNWQIGLSPHVAGDSPDAGWKLIVDQPTPEPLRLLSADWQALLRPVVVKRRLDLATRGGWETVWLQIVNSPGTPGTPGIIPGIISEAAPANGADETPDTLLAVAAMGEGHVLFLATALDPDWSNLTTKPLFLPLMHETLRGILGSGAEATRLNAVVCGDQPALGPHWEGTQELQRWGDRGTMPVLRTDHGLEPAMQLETPGIYIAKPGSGLRLAVNPDADAGNTQALDAAALGQWLNGLGQWSWFEEAAPGQALVTQPPRTSLGWPLLWLTLALLLLETYLARAFSHARIPDRAAVQGGSRDWDLPESAGRDPAVDPAQEEEAAA